jgi:hypothetical protein
VPGMRRLIAGLDINERIVHCALCHDKHAVPAIEPAEPPCPFRSGHMRFLVVLEAPRVTSLSSSRSRTLRLISAGVRPCDSSHRSKS